MKILSFWISVYYAARRHAIFTNMGLNHMWLQCYLYQLGPLQIVIMVSIAM